MNIENLKSNIESGSEDTRFMVWEMSDDYSEVIARQYIHKLSDI